METRSKKVEKYIGQYSDKREHYKKLSEIVKNIINEVLQEKHISCHSINNRAKEVESFAEKIVRKGYKDPLRQMQDLSGIRIINYIEDDVKSTCHVIEGLFKVEEKIDKSSGLTNNTFGYKSVHYVARLSDRRLELPEFKRYKDDVFEIQVRTLLQHTWAEIEHDRNYKFKGVLPKESNIKRRFALLAGLLEMADREFNSISKDLDMYAKATVNNIEKGDLDIELNSTSLREYMSIKFKEHINDNNMGKIQVNEQSYNKVIKELKNMGVRTISELDKVMSKYYDNKLKESISNNNLSNLLKAILMIENTDEHFEKEGKKFSFKQMSEKTYEILKNQGINVDKYLKRYSLNVGEENCGDS
ncbi:MAG: hypothetical protein N4A57_13855 [Anaeromicrobium sp.]|jgi:ppGpp synthetase/RelA/SpoT-type nucleotidyltranferase|uniref:GTP pyrophosphokinase n=1 Tax=Anaeromicrobium sp. TaxID=1929132 RepID=UPI0025DCA96C|nr:hypothetical protein [Anaeromicrobium sp.]MCT4595330.1 hypothetical protein [Anaeromicrobium sp.]